MAIILDPGWLVSSVALHRCLKMRKAFCSMWKHEKLVFYYSSEVLWFVAFTWNCRSSFTPADDSSVLMSWQSLRKASVRLLSAESNASPQIIICLWTSALASWEVAVVSCGVCECSSLESGFPFRAHRLPQVQSVCRLQPRITGKSYLFV